MSAIHHLMNPALRYFLEVARCGSISEASKRLNVATSAISRQISGLEESLNTLLFERRSRGMVLSAAGELLAAHARKAQLETDRVLGDIQTLEGLRRGHVRLACSEGFAMEFVPACIAEFRHEYKGIHFQIMVCSPNTVSDMVRNGETDIGLTFSLAPAENITVVYRQPSPIHAIMPADHPLGSKQQLTLAQLQPYAMALPLTDTTVRRLFDICRSHQQRQYDIALESNYMAALTRFSLFGGGISLSGEISVRRMADRGDLKAIPIRDRGMDVRNIEVQTLSGRTLPRAVQAFLSYLIKRLPEQTRTLGDD